ncbi:hypothetical protein GTH44_43140 [Bradyrhizobium japonicum]|nr:hypothetical protein [Bradyrhizobium japonicum]NLS75370.1 hypothetical protein [Bradyrhizobium brasilense]NWL44148.1 hypothetical protein [Bradyrhizobium elkanii]NWL75001.1 hypothetical protein [Bradyrhizobium elkanii]RYM29382.1 hypothetical protein EWH13_11140 [Bradyrhizobium elkanii]
MTSQDGWSSPIETASAELVWLSGSAKGQSQTDTTKSARCRARHRKLPPRRHEELPPPWIAEERANERGTELAPVVWTAPRWI